MQHNISSLVSVYFIRLKLGHMMVTKQNRYFRYHIGGVVENEVYRADFS